MKVRSHENDVQASSRSEKALWLQCTPWPLHAALHQPKSHPVTYTLQLHRLHSYPIDATVRPAFARKSFILPRLFCACRTQTFNHKRRPCSMCVLLLPRSVRLPSPLVIEADRFTPSLQSTQSRARCRLVFNVPWVSSPLSSTNIRLECHHAIHLILPR